ncbi:hypothetical protein Q8A67_018999 [Cirrhinus molitorella]|uniref:Uncharacterized protein n=1 Tax=Cirrhinus molitorella TaxID=172907 RepID=A0AA88PA96_9TELE|nr:hypothetical protein Q8A67_018999 [Cirrhinus molitorella]
MKIRPSSSSLLMIVTLACDSSEHQMQMLISSLWISGGAGQERLTPVSVCRCSVHLRTMIGSDGLSVKPEEHQSDPEHSGNVKAQSFSVSHQDEALKVCYCSTYNTSLH